MSQAKPLREAPRDHSTITETQNNLILPHFTADDAYSLGTSLRTRIRSLSQKPAVINITSTNNDMLLFHACTRSGVTPDNDLWVARKRKTVKRWGTSTWAMGRKFEGNEAEFAAKFMLGDTAGEYAIHGGGVPVRVEGVEGVVAVVVVSGLKQEEDHMVVVEALEEFIAQGKGVDSGVGDSGVGDDSVEDGGVGTDDIIDDGAATDPSKTGVVGSKKLAETNKAKVMIDEQKAGTGVLAS